MQLQLIKTELGYSAAAWESGLLAGITIPCSEGKEAVATLEGYLKMKPGSLEKCSVHNHDLEHYLEESINSYFSGKPVNFNVPLLWSRLTPFQERVLKVVKDIPYGSFLSYGEIARQIGCPKGARAVGGAVGSNPWIIVVPCHRVLAGSGGLGGFGCGLDWKMKLLGLEKIGYNKGHRK